MTPVDCPAPIPRRKRRRWLILLLVSGMVLGGVFLYLYLGATLRVKQVLAETDRLDPGWRLEEIEAARERAAPPDEENSVLTVQAAMKLMPPRWPEWDNLPVYRELLPEPASEDLPVEKLPPPAIVEFLPGEKVQDPLPFSSSEDEDEDLRETRVFVEALRKLQPPQRLNEEQKKRIRRNKPGGCGPGTSPAPDGPTAWLFAHQLVEGLDIHARAAGPEFPHPCPTPAMGRSVAS